MPKDDIVKSIPEWIDNDTQLAGGLDLLGLRNVAQSISNYCLNGITTISPQVRYLGIRSWILLMYARCQLPDDYSTFLKFGARLESAVAIGTLLNNPNMTGVVGGTKASEIIDKGESLIEPERLVQQLALNMYTGPSTDLGVAFHRDSGITGLTKERGQLLADAIMEKVKNTHIVKKILATKQVEFYTQEELLELGIILTIDNIPLDEREILLDIVMPKDEGINGWENDIRRIATYTLLLQQAKESKALPTVDNFFDRVINPSHNHKECLDEILDGWLGYLIRDSIAVVHENTLKVIVDELNEVSNKSISRVNAVNTCLNNVNSIISMLKSVELLGDDEDYEELHISDVINKIGSAINLKDSDSLFQRWSHLRITEQYLIKEIQSNSVGSIALLPVVWILSYFRLNGVIPEDNLLVARLSRGGWGRIGLKEVIFPTIESWKSDNPKFHQVLADLLSRTIDQHVRISWSRMATDLSKDVSVLKVDGDKIQFRKDFYSGRTASRLKETIGWLKQLKLIDKNGLTNDGEDALLRGYNSLSEYYSVN
ncbi:MAG: hypothetical protein H8E71_06350 [Candidatus Marinimicrobia bacterium]|nr:hypothetical protein [Candidatus Neomarinimicrobiota bacterium]